MHDNDGAKCLVYAITIRHVFYKKEPMKDLHFYSGGSINNDASHLLIPTEKSPLSLHEIIRSLTRYCMREGLLVEATLHPKCEPLTVSQ